MATSCARGKQVKSEGKEAKEKCLSIVRVKSGLTWASRVSRGAGVPGTSSPPTLGRSQDTRGVGPPTEPRTLERQGIRERAVAGPQETSSRAAVLLLCPLGDD